MANRIKTFVESMPFHRFIVAVIVLAGVVAGLETSAAIMAQHGLLLHGVDKFIFGVFIVEALLKMAAHRRQQWRYFADGWIVFDFLIVALCLLPVGGPFAAVLRLVSALPKLQLLVGALLKKLSAMGYLGMLLALQFYIYAMAWIHLFGPNDPQNFGSLPAALLTLFRIGTRDNCGDIFLGQLAKVPALKVTIYFVTFIVFGTMIILNLFIGILMISMPEMHAESAERDRAQHEHETSAATLEDELQLLEAELKATQTRLAGLRRKHRRGGLSVAPAQTLEGLAA